MAKTSLPVLSRSGGEIGEEIQGRVNLEGYGATAALLQNFFPDTAGNSHFRPGLKFCTTGPASGQGGRIEPFYASAVQKYLMWFSNGEIRFVQNGGVIVTAAVSSTVANGIFAAGLASWTNISGGGSTVAGGAFGLVLAGDGTNIAGVRQQVSTSSTGVQHSLQIRVTRGPVIFRCGSAAGTDDYISVTSLRTGTHVLSFTPSGSYWIQFSSPLRRQIVVQDVSVLGAGDLVLPTPWDADEIWQLRLEQSLNVVYVADGESFKRRIERRGSSSWSIVLSDEQDGPFMYPNTDSTLTLTPSALVGNATLTASRAFFKTAHVGALFRLTHVGQRELVTVSGADQWSSAVLVTGTSTGRTLYWAVTGAFVGTVRLQRSIGNDTSWEDVSGGTGVSSTTTAGSFSFRDGQDNVNIYYRVGIKSGEYTSGSPLLALTFLFGTSVGVGRVTGFTSSTQVSIEILDPFGGFVATADWEEGSWSDYRGHVKGISIFNGRLWNGRDDEFWGSASDIYESQLSGDLDADAIKGTISVGSSSPDILWMLGLGRLLVGTSASAADVSPIKAGSGLVTISSSALDEVLTPSNVNVKSHNATGVYVDQSGHTAQELVWSSEANDYAPRSLMRLHRDFGRPGLRQLSFASRPDMRLFLVRIDGVCLVKLFDHNENTFGWSRLVTDGEVKSVAVLPSSEEDEVYLLVDRTDGAGQWYLEKLDPMYLSSAAAANRLDSYARYDGVPVNNISGATHLNGRTVKIWADGAYMGEDTVTSGSLTNDLPSDKSSIVVGLNYVGKDQSSRLAVGAQGGSALAQRGKPVTIAFMLTKSTRMVSYGQTFDLMDTLPDRGNDTTYDAAMGLVSETTDFMPVPGDFNRDPRLCLQVESPFPVTIQGVVLGHALSEKVHA